VLRTIRRCLEKRPDERFQSTRDLAFALESALESSSASGPAAMSALPTRAWRSRAAFLVVGLALGAAIAWLVTRPSQSGQTATTHPTFRQLTFERGTIRDARFTPDGQSVVYGAAWEGNPLRIFMTRTDAPESVRLSLPDARLMSIARTGEMAVSLGHTFEGWMGIGTLARTSVLGSAPRVLAEKIREAAWTPDGSELAVARRVGSLEHLEFPLGTVLYKTSGYISDLRFSPDGAYIAFADHPLFADDAGAVSVIDRAGKRTVLAEGYTSVRGLAWSPDGHEVWFTATKNTNDAGNAVYAVTLAGQRRVVWSSPSTLKLFDVAADGRVLLGNEVADRRVEALMAGSTAPIDISLRAASTAQWISDDGSMLTIADQAAPTYTSYLIKAGGEAMLLGNGQAFGVSSDGRWVVALPIAGAPVLLHPVGAGQTRELPNPQKLVIDVAGWLPDGKHLVMFGQPQGQPSRGYVQDIDGGAPRPLPRQASASGCCDGGHCPCPPTARVSSGVISMAGRRSITSMAAHLPRSPA
jgi:Tol biopolymer transport system component